MEEKIDLGESPNGATHYSKNPGGSVHDWYRLDGTQWWFWQIGCIWEPVLSGSPCREVFPLPSTAWTGEGLPPVGTVCMVHDDDPHHHYKDHVGRQVEILAHTTSAEGGNVAVYRVDIHNSSNYHGLIAQCFRPIRTPEQIEAEERQKAVNEMCEHGIDAGDSTIRFTCEALYDAGWRKQVAQ